MTTNKYISFKIQGGVLNETLDLTQVFQNAASGFEIGAEARSWDPSYFVTTESENLWTTCAEVRENKVYYDEVLLESVGAVLPVTLLDFSGFSDTQGNHLRWSFAEIKDVSSIEIERSENGRFFTPLDASIIITTGRDSISSPNDRFFTDKKPFDLTYYRLKINDLDGSISYSKIISIKRFYTEGGVSNQDFTLTPNLTSGNFTVEMKDETANLLNCWDVFGRLVFSKKLDNTSLIYSFSTQSLGLFKGMYFLKTDKIETVAQRLIIVE